MGLVSSPRGVWASRNYLSNFDKMSVDACGVFVTSFVKNESLYWRISTKYKSSKLFWRILQHNKQNKRENGVRKTVWILCADSRFAVVWTTCCWNAMKSFPFGLRFAFCHQILAYFVELYQQSHGCLSLLDISMETEKNKAFVLCQHLTTRDAEVLNFIMLIMIIQLA